MRNWLITFTAAAIAIASPLCAEEFSETPLGALIIRDESGGKNIPNFRYDATHTAGGPCQLTDTNWRRLAPTVDIDLEKFPNAGSASEHQQNQVCWKLLAVDGVFPWTCCNKKLREDLNQQPALLKVKRRAVDKSRGPAGEAPVQAKAEPSEPHNWNVFASGTGEGGQSFLITGEGR